LRRSYNPTDVRQKYCGFCHRFHEEMATTEALQERGLLLPPLDEERNGK
jgi:hypothetical protein